MELIKRTIKQALTTGTTETCTGHCKIIIPDLAAVYDIKILLTAKAFDWGIFEYNTDVNDYYYGYGGDAIGLNNLT